MPETFSHRARELGTVLALSSLVALSSSPTKAQQQVFRSVDAQGNVTFSSEPPSGPEVRSVESVAIQPGPSEADRQAAESRAREMQRAADQYDQERRAKEEAAAKQREAAAKAAAQASDARTQDAEQWNELLVNDRVLTPAERERIEEAKRELLGAEREPRREGVKDLYEVRQRGD